MSDTQTLTGLEAARVGNGNLFVCRKCGVPKTRDQFGDTPVCQACLESGETYMRANISGADIEKTKFDLAADQLRSEQGPAIPSGVQRAHQILGGLTSTELVAEMIHQIRTGTTLDGKPAWIDRSSKLYKQALDLMQRAEKQHDEFLRTKPPEPGISLDEAKKLAVDTFIVELTESKVTRLRVLEILYRRIPTLIDEILQIGQVQVIEQPQSQSDLEEAGVL